MDEEISQSQSPEPGGYQCDNASIQGQFHSQGLARVINARERVKIVVRRKRNWGLLWRLRVGQVELWNILRWWSRLSSSVWAGSKCHPFRGISNENGGWGAKFREGMGVGINSPVSSWLVKKTKRNRIVAFGCWGRIYSECRRHFPLGSFAVARLETTLLEDHVACIERNKKPSLMDSSGFHHII